MELTVIKKKEQRKDVASSNTEIWKDIPGYEGLYQVSNFGRLKSFKKKKGGYILKNTNKNGWYFTVNLSVEGRPTKTTRIHRLVAELFIKNPNNYPHVNHKDMNKQNNHVDNLEWVTCSQNSHHAAKNKPSMVAGMNYYNRFIKTNPIMQKSLTGELIAIYRNSKEASDTTGVCQRNILQVASGDEFSPGRKRKQAGGFIWKYKTE